MSARPRGPRHGGTSHDDARHDQAGAAAPDLGEEGDELETVARLLGRAPRGDLVVVRRRADGTPSVVENAPLLRDGTPMPTRYWLVDPELRTAVSRLESGGGVRAAEEAVDPAALVLAHERYARDRDLLVPAGHAGPRPAGGVGGARAGVKCLHAHFAWWLAGGDDPVGAWVAERLGADRGPSSVRDRDEPRPQPRAAAGPGEGATQDRRTRSSGTNAARAGAHSADRMLAPRDYRTMTVVVPVYNERSTVAEVIRRVRAADVPLVMDVVVVDDGSTDGTDEVLGAISDSTVRVVRHERNRGKGAAVRTGFERATGDVVIVQDADLEYDPDDWPQLLDPILKHKAHV
ncbi:MAG: DUF501 domain-containing protein, partial [Acidimicrobiales bacterium]